MGVWGVGPPPCGKYLPFPWDCVLVFRRTVGLPRAFNGLQLGGQRSDSQCQDVAAPRELSR